MLEYGIGTDEKPGVVKMIVEYSQPHDCEAGEDDWQTIRLESVDNGVAPFIRISIPDTECGYWSISDINDLKKIVEDFEERLNYREENR